MANLGGFNAAEVPPNEAFEPLPAGIYEAVISESEMMPTKAGTGSFLKLTLQVISGEYKNRKLWTQLNLDNPSAQAVQIAKGELSAICRAVGVMVPNDSSELHNLPMMIKVGCEKRADNGDIQNRIKAYHPTGWKPGDAKSQPITTAAAPAAVAPNGEAKMGWMKK